MDDNTKLFVAEMKKQLHIKGWKYHDLAKATGFSESSIRKLAIGNRCSATLVNSVARVLDMR